MINRRTLIKSLSATGALGLTAGCAPAPMFRPVMSSAGAAVMDSPGPRSRYDLVIGKKSMTIGGITRDRLTYNGSIPGPLIHLREGDDVTLNVTNTLSESTSTHWHGFLVPFEMDGVPGVNYPGIPPGETFTYRFRVKQHGTYWYHSHSGFQEQEGVYGGIIIDPADGREPYAYDRDVVMILADLPKISADFIYSRLKKMGSGYYNYQKLTLGDLAQDLRSRGALETMRDRLAWAEMGMTPTDLLNVTDKGYIFTANGVDAAANWTALFNPGERVRVRVINASAMTHYDVRVPGLPMTMIQSDGQYIEPVETDEFRIGVAKTYDFIVHPREDRAYTVYAETLDRSGFARISLAPRAGMEGPLPAQRARPLRSLEETGMGMMDDSLLPSGGMMRDPAPNMPMGNDVNVAMRTMKPQERMSDPGVGLGDDGWRVLTENQLRSYERLPSPPVEREMFINMTTNMTRYIFSFDGKKFSQADKIPFYLGERLRLTMFNQSMMAHPIHLHGMWMELENGQSKRPRQHTVFVKPGQKLSVLITPVELGDWAFHCHMLYHFHSGMFRIVNVALKDAIAQ